MMGSVRSVQHEGILISMRVFLLCLALLIGGQAQAQELHQDLVATVRAEVVSVLHEEVRDIIGTDTNALVQEIQVRILSGTKKDAVVTLENDFVRLTEGDQVYVNHIVTINGDEFFVLKDVDRKWPLLTLGALFVTVLLIFAGLHGMRALLSLALSIGVLFGILVPLLLKGYSPVLVSICVAGPILALTLFLTHGYKSRSIIAFFGTFGAVLLTGLIATTWVTLARFTGLSSDEAIYLNFSTQGSLDFGGILLGSIIIGILGILDDVSITQASVVAELRRANKQLSFGELYTRALRVGRDHIGSLVNTLSLAYIGTSLPLVLLMVQAHSGIVLSLNQEVVAVELIRIMVGSIGLILAVPLTTLIAAWWYHTRSVEEDSHSTHGHSHVDSHT